MEYLLLEAEFGALHKYPISPSITPASNPPGLPT